MDRELKGLIIKGIGGFYYVKTQEGIYECKARGIFRKKAITPLPGDYVVISAESGSTGSIESICERKNFLIRPPVANIDSMFVVVSAASPEPNLYSTDKLLVMCELLNIKPILILNKSDLKNCEDIKAVYDNSGYDIYIVSANEGVGIENIIRHIGGNICTFAGHSGVGKSSIVNILAPHASMAVGSVSAKIESGKHTTRHVELIDAHGGYIADTPGFGDIDTEKVLLTSPDELKSCFREFYQYEGQCRFRDCSHLKEKDCAVLKAVEAGGINVLRHKSYAAIYNEIKALKRW